MIKELFKESCHDKIFEKMTPIQQMQYNNTMNKIESENTEYIVAIDLAEPKSSDKSAICKGRHINGIFTLEDIEYIDSSSDTINLKN